MRRSISGGLYLVVDPALGLEGLLPTIEGAIQGGVDVLQIWNNWSHRQDKLQVVATICALAHSHDVPVLINEAWELMLCTPLDGVHFDALPADLTAIRQKVGRPFLCGLTCGNDLSRVHWAEKNGLTYISFCSLYPSPSAGVCEIVRKETVREARRLTSLPIFLAGGITLENVDELHATGMNGIALISAILKADDPRQATKAFKNKLKETDNEAITR